MRATTTPARIEYGELPEEEPAAEELDQDDQEEAVIEDNFDCQEFSRRRRRSFSESGNLELSHEFEQAERKKRRTQCVTELTYGEETPNGDDSSEESPCLGEEFIDETNDEEHGEEEDEEEDGERDMDMDPPSSTESEDLLIQEDGNISPESEPLFVPDSDEADESQLALNPRHAGKHRGELLLDSQEATKLSERLPQGWQFGELDQIKEEVATERSVRRKIAAPKRQFVTPREPATERQGQARKGVGARQASLKRLPDWARRFHQILYQFMQNTVCAPFVEERSAMGPDYASFLEKILPAQPIALRTILSKLENGDYETAVQVFNDVYGVWICVLRSNDPGSPLWMQAQDASQAFFIQMAQQPFRDDFPCPTARSPQRKSNMGSVAATGQPQLTGLLRQFIKTIRREHARESRPGDSRATAASSLASGAGKGKSSRRGKRGSKARQQVLPITEEERAEFENLLGKLRGNDHMEMYETFKLTARWRSEDDNVELDESETPPTVIREMLEWARGKVASRGKGKMRRDSGCVVGGCGLWETRVGEERAPTSEPKEVTEIRFDGNDEISSSSADSSAEEDY